ncbi:DNA polymerase III subunit delta [Pelagibacteraceae bacterium]|jgi:DNA polymerase-3 subunit delta|nr:DNA polymerase III subunit delta [Pelagibacteraceae bacterium]|tara:strand:- start:3065 stop:4066 length:1002 start_codon:yes stop_codon:yes gene_type:complete
MILKSYIAESNVNLLNQYYSLLLYGENNGLKDDIKDRIKHQNKDSEFLNFFQDDILKNNDILLNEVFNDSLFSTKKIIIINEASDKIFNILNEILEKISDNLKIYIICNILDRKSKMRNAYEKTNNLGIIACYQDNERTLINYVNTALIGYKGVTNETINLIIQNSFLNRKIIKSELIKIKSLFLNKTLEIKKIKELLNIKLGNNFENIRDASILGEKIKVNKLISELEFHESDNFFFINQLSSRISKLIEIQYLNKNIKDDELAIESLKPKVFWKDKPIYSRQLLKWNIKKLEETLKEIGNTELLMKTKTQIKNDILLKNLLINICLNANSA